MKRKLINFVNYLANKLHNICRLFIRNEPVFITKSLQKDIVYKRWLSQLKTIEETTIALKSEDIEKASKNSMDIGYKLFPLIDSISLNLFGKTSGRKYLEKLGYSKKEAFMIYSIFRNGILHTDNPYEFEYKDGIITWGLTSSSGSGGFYPHFPGYKNIKDPKLNEPADKAFSYEKISKGFYHANLSLDRLVAHIKYDLNERYNNDKRKTIDFVVGQRFKEKTPKVETI